MPRRPSIRAWWRDARPSRRTRPLSWRPPDRDRPAVELDRPARPIRAGSRGSSLAVPRSPGTTNTAVWSAEGRPAAGRLVGRRARIGCARGRDGRRPAWPAARRRAASCRRVVVGAARRGAGSSASTTMSPGRTGRIGREAHDRPIEERVAVAPGRTRARCRPGSPPGPARGRPQSARSRRARSHDEPCGTTVRAPSRTRSGLHGPFEAALDLDRSDRGPEQPRGLALEQPFEEAFDGGKGSHVGAGV